MIAIDYFLTQVSEHGLTTVIGVLAVACIAAWCLLGITLHIVGEYRTRRAEAKAIADLQAEKAAWRTFDAHRGIRIAENYANDPGIRAKWRHLPAPKGGGNA